jgi:hypothetical protein
VLSSGDSGGIGECIEVHPEAHRLAALAVDLGVVDGDVRARRRAELLELAPELAVGVQCVDEDDVHGADVEV